MKRITLTLMAILMVAFPMFSQAPFVSIPDTAFFNALIEEGVDTNNDGYISISEAEAITKLDISSELSYCGSQAGIRCPIRQCTGTINSLEGIQDFKNLISLNCSGNIIRGLNLSQNTKLKYLDCSGNGSHFDSGLDTLDITQCKSLEYLNCSHTFLNSIDISNNALIDTLILKGLQLNHLRFNQEQDVYPVYVWESFFVDSIYIDSVIPWDFGGGSGIENIISPIQYIITNTVNDENAISFEKVFSIYPNPTASTLTFTLETPINGELEIHSLNGQLIHQRPIRSTSEQLDLSSFQKGMYFITIRSKDFIATEKIIKL